MEYSQLKITNQFMFGKIMQDPKLCKQMLEIIFNKKIKEIKYPEIEKEMKATYDSKGIRLDVYIDDDKGTVYNIEMQTQDNDHIPKRTRFYQGTMDINSLQKGMYYTELGENYVIFICNFDLFLYNRYIYTFENLCTENTEIKLNDGTHKIFLNTKGSIGNISPELKAMLDYFDGKEPSNDFTKQLEDAVIKARNNDDWRVEYMTLTLRDQDNILKGKIEGRIEAIKKLLARGDSEASILELGYTLEEITIAKCRE